jgi:hypothetical protein
MNTGLGHRCGRMYHSDTNEENHGNREEDSVRLDPLSPDVGEKVDRGAKSDNIDEIERARSHGSQEVTRGKIACALGHRKELSAQIRGRSGGSRREGEGSSGRSILGSPRRYVYDHVVTIPMTGP